MSAHTHYIKLALNFFTHRKTIKLQATLGADALWVPIRLWTYAAASQPDGDFSRYSASEIALAIGYSGNAEAMLEALLRVGLMDAAPLRIHEWGSHNSWHSESASRSRVATIAANARWAKERSKENQGTVQDSTGEEYGIAAACAEHADSMGATAPAPLPPEAQIWNSKVKGKFAEVASFNPTRMRHLKARRTDSYWVENFEAAVDRLCASNFAAGSNDRGWKADFDFVLQPESITRTMEGRYDDRKPKIQPKRGVIPGVAKFSEEEELQATEGSN
jgi:hypothetical protein